jgi:hypothetical protein
MAPGRSVVDAALAPFLAAVPEGAPARLVVVVSTRKFATVDYLSRLQETAELVFTLQHPRYGAGLGGALRAALPLCAGTTALALPDQFFAWSAEDNPVRTAFDLVATRSWAVLASPMADPVTLRAEGALRLSADTTEVVAAADKPLDPSPYDAVWASVICAPWALDDLPTLVEAGVPSPLVGAASVVVKGYTNMTTATAS